MIRVKDSSVLYALLRISYDEILMSVLTWIDKQYPGHVVITCGYRPGDKGVHGTIPCRGSDIRSWVFKDPELVRNYINHTWEYDYKRPDMQVCVYHESEPGADDWHFHIQTCSRTRLRSQVHSNTRLRK